MTFTRSTVGAILAMAIIGASALAGASTAVASQSSESGRITNVIYLLGDGMGVTHVAAARERYAGLDGRLAMETLPAHGTGQHLLGGARIRAARCRRLRAERGH